MVISGCYAVFHKQLGDLVLLEPALARLSDYYGRPVQLLTRNRHADLVTLMKGVQHVRGMACKPAQALYCFDPLPKSALRSILAPVLKRYLIPPERWELHWYHPFLFPAPSNPELEDFYIAEFFWKNTPVPTNQPFRPPVLSSPPSHWAPKGWESGRYVLVNATAGWKKKMWTIEGWTTLLQSLGSEYPFVLTSAESVWQKDHCSSIAAATGSTFLTTNTRQFLWLCANARAVLTVDGAASHLAAAFSVPCFTLFGSTSVAHWHRATAQQIAFQAPPVAPGIHPLRTLNPGPVIEAVAQLGLSIPSSVRERCREQG